MDQIKTVDKQAIFGEYGKSATDTGSIEGQISLFTSRIQHISEHLKSNKKDHSSRRSLLKMVGKRKRLLQYLAKRDLDGYRKLLEKLNLRK
jgi:small subunit ribosomal protein S15